MQAECLSYYGTLYELIGLQAHMLFATISTAEYRHEGPAAFGLQQGLSTLLFKTHESVAHIASFTVEIQLGEMD